MMFGNLWHSPEDKFNYIVERLKENEESKHTLVLVNINKLGL